MSGTGMTDAPSRPAMATGSTHSPPGTAAASWPTPPPMEVPAHRSPRPLFARRLGLLACHLFALLLVQAGCGLPRAPVETAMTSPFGLRWMGILPGIHRGVDFQAQTGTPIAAIMSGRVRFAGWMNGFGNVVWLDHSGDVISIYAHLSEVRVQTGEPIEKGAILGLSGATGNVTGPHLHFEIWKSGRPVDPAHFLGM